MLCGSEGPFRLSAVLEGFKLLNTALQYDLGAAEAINSMTVRERVAPLHLQVVNPQRRLAVLLQYVLYSNMDLQYEVRRVVVCVCVLGGATFDVSDLLQASCFCLPHHAHTHMATLLTSL